MFTGVDKFLAAVIWSVVYAINNFTDVHFALTEDQVNALVLILSPLTVWLVPNKQKSALKD